MKDTVRTTLVSGIAWPTLRDTQPAPKQRKPRVVKPRVAKDKKERVRKPPKPPVLTTPLMTLPKKIVEVVDYHTLIAMLDAGPVTFAASEMNRCEKVLREHHSYPLIRRTKTMTVDGVAMLITTMWRK